MEAQNLGATTRIGAYTAIGGSVCALLGAALWGASGTDIDAALAAGEMADYLVAAGESTFLIVANLTLWIVMALLLGVAGTAMTLLSERRQLLAQIARYSYWTGVPLVIAAYVAWLAVVLRVAPDTSPAAILVAEAMGWFASRADLDRHHPHRRYRPDAHCAGRAWGLGPHLVIALELCHGAGRGAKPHCHVHRRQRPGDLRLCDHPDRRRLDDCRRGRAAPLYRRSATKRRRGLKPNPGRSRAIMPTTMTTTYSSCYAVGQA